MIEFGTGGWRAVIGDDYTRENIEKIATALSLILKEDKENDKPIVLGYDNRFLSDITIEWLIGVFSYYGIKTIAMDESCPSPLVMFLVKHNNYNLGLMVTASHNPPQWNGIKVIVKEGRDAPVEYTKRIEEKANKITKINKLTLEEAKKQNLVTTLSSPREKYISKILSFVNVEKIRESHLSVILDPMHGSGKDTALDIFQTLNINTTVINGNKDAYFGGGYPSPSEDRLMELESKAKDFSIAFAFDGDGDRLSVIDEDGSYLSMNEILVMLYWYLHEVKGWKGGVVRNICTTHILDREAQSFNEKCTEVPVGFKWVSKAIGDENAILGGESSGGLAVRGHIYGKDAIYAATLFIDMVVETKLRAKAIREKMKELYGEAHQVELALTFKKQDKAKIQEALLIEKRLPYLDNVRSISYLDGLKVNFSDMSFVSCRFSGTEPLLRIIAEAPTVEKASAYCQILKDFVSNR